LQQEERKAAERKAAEKKAAEKKESRELCCERYSSLDSVSVSI
jgi:hypothetical protein